MRNAVIFRVDGSTKTGLGHVYRCIAVAEMLSPAFDCSFAMNAESINTFIPPKFKVTQLPVGLTTEDEPQWLGENVNAEKNVLILDGYHFNPSYQKKLKEKKFRLIYIDDLHEGHAYADALINHSPEKNESLYKKESYTKLYLGCDYVMLRRSFLEKAKSGFKTPEQITSAFISMGGSDEFNLTGKCMDAVIALEKIKQINIVTGPAFKHLETIKNKAANASKPVLVHNNLSENEIVDLMEKADIAFSPASNTCLELMALKKIIFAGHSASNQLGLYNYFTSNNLVFPLGDLHKITAAEISKIVDESLLKRKNIADMLQLQNELIDGNSGQRIAKIVEEIAK
jgi:UDP-2,4-diacetamido-2,4,6-trideoxy-beta-L-altropyranose hydrolase